MFEYKIAKDTFIYQYFKDIIQKAIESLNPFIIYA